MENSIYKITSNIQKTITRKINIFQYIFEQIPVISWNKKEFMTMSDNTTTKDATEVKGNIFFLYFILSVKKLKTLELWTFYFKSIAVGSDICPNAREDRVFDMVIICTMKESWLIKNSGIRSNQGYITRGQT